MKKLLLPNYNPFVVEFEYGASKEGYWCYEHMILQLEDCVDVVQTLYPEFDFLFMFDHSCGHDRQRDDALNADHMSRGFGGKQKEMRSTKIKDVSYFGSFERTLNVGDTQFMQYKDDDEGPFYLTPEQRQQQKHDRTIHNEFVTKAKTKAELVTEL